jgi:hypothetical protein
MYSVTWYLVMIQDPLPCTVRLTVSILSRVLCHNKKIGIIPPININVLFRNRSEGCVDMRKLVLASTV